MTIDTVYLLIVAATTVAAGIHVTREWRADRRYRRQARRVLRNLTRDDRGFGRVPL